MKKIQKLTRVVIDDDRLVDEAVRLGGHRTKREAAEAALRHYIQYYEQIQFTKLNCDPSDEKGQRQRASKRLRRGGTRH